MCSVVVSVYNADIKFDNWTLSGQYTECLSKFLFVQTNCMHKKLVKILLAMVTETLRLMYSS